MARYHITLRDNDTGNVAIDCETSCIIGAFYDSGADNVGTLVAINCKCDVAVHTTFCAAKAVQLAQDDHPEIAALIALRAMADKVGNDDD